MSFKENLKDVGFKSKRQFAQHVGKDPTTVTRWKDNPPQWVGLYFMARKRIFELTGGFE